MEDEDVNMILDAIKRKLGGKDPEEIEGELASKWRLKGGIVMDLRGGNEWDFSSRARRNKAR